MKLIDAKRLAELLGVSDSRAYELIRAGIIPSVRLGRQVRVSEEALQRPTHRPQETGSPNTKLVQSSP